MTETAIAHGKRPFSRARIRSTLHAICWVFAVFLVGFSGAVDFICLPYEPPPILAGAQGLFAILAFLFLLEHLVIRSVPVQWALSTLTTLICITCVLGACHFLSVDLVPSGMRRARDASDLPTAPASSSASFKPIGIYQFHERYGYDHIPNREGTHKTADFEVIYTIDANRCRVTPTPEVGRGRILVTGGSFTFGHGVENEECYPSVLGSTYWPDYKILNRAVCGYGTVHAYMLVSDLIDGSEAEPPNLVIYAMIPGHVVRNYIRKNYVGLILRLPFFIDPSEDPLLNRRGYPHFELKDGKLDFCGVIGAEETARDSPYLGQYELALTEAFLDGMRTTCSEKGVPFVVVILPERLGASSSSVTAILERLSIPYLDISGMPIETFPIDPHPNSQDHQQIASAIAGSFVTDMLHSTTREEP